MTVQPKRKLDIKQALYNSYTVNEKWRDYLQHKITHDEYVKYARLVHG